MSKQEQMQLFKSELETILGQLSFSYNCSAYEIRQFGEEFYSRVVEMGQDKYKLTVHHAGKGDAWFETLVVKKMNPVTETFREEFFRVTPVSGSEEWEFVRPFYSRVMRGSPEGCASLILRLVGVGDDTI